VQKAVGADADGNPGPETWIAIHNRLCPEPAGRGVSAAELASPPPLLIDRVDDRSENIIATLLPEVQPYARGTCDESGPAWDHDQGDQRSGQYDEQNELFAQGRTKPGRIVSNARAGFSNHNFGIAFDIGVFEGTKYLDESPKYKAVGVLGMDLGLEWGGNWKTIVDEPHFQLRPKWAGHMKERDMLAELRTRQAKARTHENRLNHRDGLARRE
jgi:peptidoglycan L-alanyl-D-glutamate endopeptidase CwlK